MRKLLLKRLRDWWRGPYVQYDSPSLWTSGHHEPPLLARLCSTILGFLRSYWQWIIMLIVAVIAIIVKATH